MTHTTNASDITCTAFKNGEYLRGIYNGYSHKTGNYHVSFFNGENGRYLSIVSIMFDETDDGSCPDRAIGLLSTTN